MINMSKVEKQKSRSQNPNFAHGNVHIYLQAVETKGTIKSWLQDSGI